MTPRTGSRRKRVLIGATAIVLAGAGLGTWFATKSSGAATPAITTSTKTRRRRTCHYR